MYRPELEAGPEPVQSAVGAFNIPCEEFYLYSMFQEEQNRGKPNWEHLNDELHVLITVEDSENRAQLKLERAVDEVKKLLTVVSKSDIYFIYRDWSEVFLSDNCAQF